MTTLPSTSNEDPGPMAVAGGDDHDEVDIDHPESRLLLEAVGAKLDRITATHKFNLSSIPPCEVHELAFTARSLLGQIKRRRLSPNNMREELRTPDGWLIRRVGDEISVMAPDACPGMTTVAAGKGRLEARLLHALANAFLTSAPLWPSPSDTESSSDPGVFAARLDPESMRAELMRPVDKSRDAETLSSNFSDDPLALELRDLATAGVRLSDYARPNVPPTSQAPSHEEERAEGRETDATREGRP